MERERLGSRIGFILLSAGCAIGIGNVWKFPYITGQYGGAIFVLIYLLFLVILGIPVMTMEFSVGRAAQKSPVHMYQQLEKKGTKWHIHGLAAFLGNFILMMCYTTIAGWMLQYFFNTARGLYVGMDAAQVGESFGHMLANPVSMTIFMAVVVIAGFAINSIGLQKGLERITKYMMGSLIVLIPGCQQHLPEGLRRRPEILPAAQYPEDKRGRNSECDRRRYESGILYPESWHRFYGHLRQLSG